MDPRLVIALTRALPTIRGSGRLAAFLMNKVTLPPGQIDLPVHGYRVGLEPREFVDRWLIFAPQLYDHREIGLLRRSLRPGDVFVDVGAHVGVYTLAASRMVGGDGTVLAIEPDPVTFARLKRTVERNGLCNVRLANIGVSDRNEQLRLGMNVFGNRGGSSFLYHRDFPGVEVACVPLAAVLEAHEIRTVTAAKLDIEGFEHRVLSAFFETAPRALLPRLLIVEHVPGNVARTGDVVSLVLSHGYRERSRAGQNRIFTRAP